MLYIEIFCGCVEHSRVTWLDSIVRARYLKMDGEPRCSTEMKGDSAKSLRDNVKLSRWRKKTAAFRKTWIDRISNPDASPASWKV